MSPAGKEPNTPAFLKHFAGVYDPRQEAKVDLPVRRGFSARAVRGDFRSGWMDGVEHHVLARVAPRMPPKTRRFI